MMHCVLLHFLLLVYKSLALLLHHKWIHTRVYLEAKRDLCFQAVQSALVWSHCSLNELSHQPKRTKLWYECDLKSSSWGMNHCGQGQQQKHFTWKHDRFKCMLRLEHFLSLFHLMHGPCQKVVPTRPTLQLHCSQLGWRFRCVMLV